MLGCWCCTQANRNLAAERPRGFDSLRARKLAHILSHAYTPQGGALLSKTSAPPCFLQPREKRMQDRIDHLKAITALPVHRYTERGVSYYVFGHEYIPIKIVCTYRKARAFAEGFAAGRSPIIATSYPPRV